MAIFGFLKKKQAPPAPQPAPVAPTISLLEQVQQLQQQGMTDAEMVQYFQAQGVPPQQIYDALSQTVASQGPEPFAPPAPEPEAPHEVPDTEELVESIVQEHWKEVQGELKKLQDTQVQNNTRLEKFEQGMEDLKSDVANLHKAVVAKLGEYDKSLLDVGTEIKAMEKVFQKVLPELTDSVQKLSRMAKK